MQRPSRLTRLYIDFDAFFAHVEKQLDPSLHGRPVAVTPMPSRYSGVIACCYQAKARGVKRGMKCDEAEELCPGIIFRHARHDVYVKIHHQIKAEVNRFMPVLKTWSIDEVECGVPARTTEEAVALARLMRQSLADTIGPIITPSIGLSCNQLLAKIAAEMNKPRGLIVLHPDSLPGKLLDVPLDDVPGIAAGMLPRLASAGVHDMAGLWNLAPKQARAIWGNVQGERLWAELHGYMVPRPDTKRSMFGHSRVLSGDWRKRDKARECLILLAAKATRRMRADNFMATKLTVGIKDAEGQRVSHELQFPPARDDFTLLKATRQAFEICSERTISRVYAQTSVYLHGLKKEGEFSDDLFEQADAPKTKQRHETLSDVMDGVNARFGGNTLNLGTREEPPGGYAGAKIAFGRVPDIEDFST